MIRWGYRRIYQNFLMPTRIPEYRRLLSEVKARGFESITVRELADVARGLRKAGPRTFVLRVDVDSDVATARAMFEIGQELGIRSTYYFRLSTLDPKLMRDIHAAGSEVGYHFEELATVAKARGLRDLSQIKRHIGEMRELFAANLEKYREAAGQMPETVSSHGDFVNRAVGVTNSCLVDAEMRERFGLIAEAYDPWLNKPITKRLADAPPPKWWYPEPPDRALEMDSGCLYILFHPRQWCARPIENLRLDLERAVEGLRYRLPHEANLSHRRGIGPC
jgi:hypothetical protein